MPRIQPRRLGQHVPGLGGQPLHQQVVVAGQQVGQRRQVRPRPLRVDVIGGQRRDAAEVVHPGLDQQQALGQVDQVRRGLQPQLRAEHQPGHCQRGQVLVQIQVRIVAHRGVVLGPEVLHDHFLDRAELAGDGPDREQRLGPLEPGLPDADQDAGGERHVEPAGVGEHSQPDLGVLVRAAVVRAARLGEQPPGGGLQHHPHARRDRLQPLQLGPAQHAGIEVRQQPGPLQHRDGRGPQVVQRRAVAALVQPLPSLRPALLGPVAEGEQRLLAAQLGTPAGDLDHLVEFQVGGRQPMRDGGEGAVVAAVPA